MKVDRSITGNLVNAFYICHRKVWLFAHEINPSTENSYLEIGSLIGEESYKREKKEIHIGDMKIDLIKKAGNNVVVAEIKKSSKGEKAAKMQLLFYLYQLKAKGIKANGELLIPKERKRILITLDEEVEKELIDGLKKIKEIIAREKPPEKVKTHFCKNCAYNEFCWS